jgi:hypothetical protein
MIQREMLEPIKWTDDEVNKRRILAALMYEVIAMEVIHKTVAAGGQVPDACIVPMEFYIIACKDWKTIFSSDSYKRTRSHMINETKKRSESMKARVDKCISVSLQLDSFLDEGWAREQKSILSKYDDEFMKMYPDTAKLRKWETDITATEVYISVARDMREEEPVDVNAILNDIFRDDSRTDRNRRKNQQRKARAAVTKRTIRDTLSEICDQVAVCIVKERMEEEREITEDEMTRFLDSLINGEVSDIIMTEATIHIDSDAVFNVLLIKEMAVDVAREASQEISDFATARVIFEAKGNEEFRRKILRDLIAEETAELECFVCFNPIKKLKDIFVATCCQGGGYVCNECIAKKHTHQWRLEPAVFRALGFDF